MKHLLTSLILLIAMSVTAQVYTYKDTCYNIQKEHYWRIQDSVGTYPAIRDVYEYSNETKVGICELRHTEIDGKNAWYDAALVYIPDNSDSLTTYSQKGADFEYRRGYEEYALNSEGNYEIVNVNYPRIGFENNSQKAGLVLGFNYGYYEIIALASDSGYLLPSDSVKWFQNNHYLSLEIEGIMDSLDLYYVFATDGDSDFATLNWKDPPQFQATKVNAPAFITNEGFAGDGSSSYLTTGYNPSTNAINLSLNDNSIGVYNRNPSANRAMISAFGSNYLEIIAGNSNTRYAFFNMITFGDIINVGTDSQDGFIIASRNNSSDYDAYKNGGILFTGSRTSVNIPNAELSFLARPNTSNYGDAQLSIGFAGASLNAKASEFNIIVEAYMDNLNKGVQP